MLGRKSCCVFVTSSITQSRMTIGNDKMNGPDTRNLLVCYYSSLNCLPFGHWLRLSSWILNTAQLYIEIIMVFPNPVSNHLLKWTNLEKITGVNMSSWYYKHSAIREPVHYIRCWIHIPQEHALPFLKAFAFAFCHNRAQVVSFTGPSLDITQTLRPAGPQWGADLLILVKRAELHSFFDCRLKSQRQYYSNVLLCQPTDVLPWL